MVRLEKERSDWQYNIKLFSSVPSTENPGLHSISYGSPINTILLVLVALATFLALKTKGTSQAK